MIPALLHDRGDSAIATGLGSVVFVGDRVVVVACFHREGGLPVEVRTSVRRPRTPAIGAALSFVQIQHKVAFVVPLHVVAVVDLRAKQYPRREVEAMVMDGRILEAASARQFGVPDVQALTPL